MTSRTPREQMDELAEDALTEALREVGLRAERVPGVGLVVSAGSTAITLRPVALSAPAVDAVRAIVGKPLDAGTVGVVVGDRLFDPVRDVLRQAGWGWLDRRGHLRLQGSGVIVDTAVGALPRRGGPSGRTDIAGRSGISLALALLMDPDRPLRVREIARASGLSPAAISQARARLRNGSLIEEDGRPLVPELFWALAETWGQADPWVAVGRLPQSDNDVEGLLGVGADPDAVSRGGPGWAVAGGGAATAWGAPLVEAGLGTVDFYVASETVVLRARKLLGEPAPIPVARLAVAPSQLVVTRRFSEPRPASGGWPLVHPVVAALDLALDPGRGREAVEDWTPPPEFRRVW